MKRLIALGAVLALAASAAFAQTSVAPSSVQMLTDSITTDKGQAFQLRCTNRTFQAMGTTSAGVGASAIIIEGSNKATPVTTTTVDWTTLGTISLTLGTTQTSDGFVSYAAWRWIRARVSSISGTDATVNAWAGC